MKLAHIVVGIWAVIAVGAGYGYFTTTGIDKQVHFATLAGAFSIVLHALRSLRDEE